MGLEAADIETIKATWLCVRQDEIASGCLLFKMLFTRYPQYLQLFPQFPDLDLERMRENRRLLRHAVKVIETVSFVVDSIGDKEQTSTLNEALVNLVKSHLKRKIGLEQFNHLGVVLIDFICDVNHLNGSTTTTTTTTASSINDNSQQAQLNTTIIDTKSLRSSWAQLYDIILSLVKQQQQAATATA